MDDVRQVAESIFRIESGRIIATLIRQCGSFHLAEEAMQEAFAAALAHWPDTGVPANPAAWITTCARRKVTDAFRRMSTRSAKDHDVRFALYNGPAPETDSEDGFMNYPDDRLRLIFTCCHPAINRASQVALTLRTLCGLTTAEIARAFLISEPTLAQRLVRAKDKIQRARIPYAVPPPKVLPERLASVQSVIYLVFNEGYSATTGGELTRELLCEEGIRLGRLLDELLPGDAETMGLLALMLLQDSRRHARTDPMGDLVPLEEQDRACWDRRKIDEGSHLIEAALRKRQPGPYQLQGAIAALHAQSSSPERTDWSQIAALYRELLRLRPTSVIALNSAVATAMAGDMNKGLAKVEALGRDKAFERYHLYHAARAELLRRMGRHGEACAAYRSAILVATNDVERRYLSRRLGECSSAETLS